MPTFYGKTIDNPLMLGTARYPSNAAVVAAFEQSGAQVATVSLRRHEGADATFKQLIDGLGVAVLPNTAGCFDVKSAVTTAHMARELFGTRWIKLEVIGHQDTLQPDALGTVEAARILCQDGFEVFPYCTEDLTLCHHLVNAGCKVLMPWGAPIGSVMGLNNPFGLQQLRREFPDITLVVDAGIGLPSHAASAMEMGYDAVLINSAVASAGNPPQMAVAMAKAVEAGRAAWLAKPAKARAAAVASSPTAGLAELS